MRLYMDIRFCKLAVDIDVVIESLNFGGFSTNPSP